MSATLQVGASTYDLYFTQRDPVDHQHDVTLLNHCFVMSNLPLPALPEFPEARLNRVVWPVVGLSHHAYGHLLLANEDAVTTGTTCTLHLTDGDADAPRDLSLYILARRPLSDTRAVLNTAPDAADDGQYFDGWVVTVVDARYLRRKRVGTGDTTWDTSTWGDLINNAGTAAGFTMPSPSAINAKVHADFGTPDATAWSVATLAGESYAVVADAAALAVGLRITVATDGTVAVDAPSDSATKYTNWLAAAGRDTFRDGGIGEGRYAAPLSVGCQSPTGSRATLNLPAPTPRLSDSAPADLTSGLLAFQTKWVETYSNWLNVTQVTGDMNGFVLPPVTGVQQHVEYAIQEGYTRIVALPARYPLPLLRGAQATGGSSAFWSTSASGILSTSSQTGGGRKTSTDEGASQNGDAGWWVDSRYQLTDGRSPGTIPYVSRIAQPSVSLGQGTHSVGEVNVHLERARQVTGYTVFAVINGVSYPLTSTPVHQRVLAVDGGPMLSAPVVVTSMFNAGAFGSGTSSESPWYRPVFCIGSPTFDYEWARTNTAYAVARYRPLSGFSTNIHVGIDRTFAAGDRPIVIGGITVGYATGPAQAVVVAPIGPAPLVNQPPPVVEGPVPPPTAPPEQQGIVSGLPIDLTTGQVIPQYREAATPIPRSPTIHADTVAAGTVYARRLLMVSADGSKFEVTVSNLGSLTTTPSTA